MPAEIVFLFDVDNTLLDNDRVEADIGEYVAQVCGDEARERFWAIFAERRTQLGYADYLGSVQSYRMEALHDPRVLTLGEFLLDYPFASRLYPQALEALEHVRQWGRSVILSDGDAVFQPHKIRRAGIWNAVAGRVLIDIHKEQMLDDVRVRHPAARYVMVDDKLNILSAMKSTWGQGVTTVFPQQGHYAHDTAVLAAHSAADITLAQIADLTRLGYSDFARAA